MNRTTLALALAVMVAGCGVDDAMIDSNVAIDPPVQFDSLRPPPSHTPYYDQARPYLSTVPVETPLIEAQPIAPGVNTVRNTPGCRHLSLVPVTAGTLRQVPAQGIFEPVNPASGRVEASFQKSNGVDEEVRVGIAEFDVGPDPVVSATLHFTERRAMLPAANDDAYALTVYPADLVLTLADWKTPGDPAPDFRDNMSAPPQANVTTDLTKFVQNAGKRVGIRFELGTRVDGHGTSFEDLTLEVDSCNPSAL